MKEKLNKTLRNGYTTGTCATAVAKASVLMLFKSSDVHHVTVVLPVEEQAVLEIEEIERHANTISCMTRKDAGDDPDVTNGIKIYAKARGLNNAEIRIIAGKGIGTVTKPGLAVEVGKPAINPVPMRMISQAIAEVLPEGKGVEVEISIPEGEEIAKRTFNPKLGIQGGISVLGTTGIVKPMSEEALKKSLELYLKQLAYSTKDNVIFVPGNYATSFLQNHCSVNENMVVQCSNFLGFMLEKAVKYGFKKVLLVGHIGKLIKLASGIFHTHSRIADARNETLTAHYLTFCNDAITAQKLMQVNTTEEAVDLIPNKQFWDYMAERIKERSQTYIYNDLEIEVILFSQHKRFLGATKNIASFPGISRPETESDILQLKTQITVCGIGPGNRNYILQEVYSAVANSDVIIGGKRHLELFEHHNKVCFNGNLKELNTAIEHSKGKTITVVVSGDTGFYSLRNYINKQLSWADIKLIPGISSFQYLYAKLNMGYENGKLLSLHGRESDFISELRNNDTVFLLTDRHNNFQQIASTLIENELSDTIMVVGNNLSYPDEKILTGTAHDLVLSKESFPLCAVILKSSPKAN